MALREFPARFKSLNVYVFGMTCVQFAPVSRIPSRIMHLASRRDSVFSRVVVTLDAFDLILEQNNTVQNNH